MLVMVQCEVENSLLSFDAVDVDLGRSGISFYESDGCQCYVLPPGLPEEAE